MFNRGISPTEDIIYDICNKIVEVIENNKDNPLVQGEMARLGISILNEKMAYRPVWVWSLFAEFEKYKNITTS